MNHTNKNDTWYVISTFTGYENNVKVNLEKRISSMNLEDRFFDILIPSEKVIEINQGKKKEKEVKKFPGYVLINMIMDNETWIAVKNTPGVISFIGSYDKLSKPAAISKEEITKIFSIVEKNSNVNVILDYSIGDIITIVQGKFAGNAGKVLEIDIDNNIVKIEITMLGKQILDLKMEDIQRLQ